LVLISAMIAMAGLAHAQQPPPDANTPPAAQPPAADKAPAGPSEDILKRAKAVGMRPEVRKGETVYCWEDADIGTHFKTKKCVDENRLSNMIEQRELQKQVQKRQSN
jgi:hypothetical protein